MGIESEGLPGEKGSKGEPGIPGSMLPRTPLTNPNTIISGPKGDQGPKGEQVNFSKPFQY